MLLDLLLRIAVVFRPLPVIDALTLPDDAYLSLQIARNIARGLGPLYGNGYTNGYQPLYVLLMVPVYRLFTTDPILPIKIALTLAALFDALTLALLCRLARRLTGSSRAALVLAAAWIFNGYVIQTSLNGLETGISFFFIVASFNAVYALIDKPEMQKPRRMLELGLLLGLAVLSRIDNLILATAIGGMLLVHQLRQGGRWTGISSNLALLGAGMAVVNLPWLVWSYRYTGLLFPISGRAVRFMSLSNVRHHPTWHNMYWPMLKKALQTFGYRNGLIIDALGVVALVGVVLVVQGRWVRTSLSASPSAPPSGSPSYASSASASGSLPQASSVSASGSLSQASSVSPSGSPSLASSVPSSLSGPALKSAAARLAGPVAYGLMMISAYAFYIFTPWFFDRYLFPLLAPLLMILAVAVEQVARALEQRAAASASRSSYFGQRLGLTRPTRVLICGLAVLLAGGMASLPRFRSLYSQLEPDNRGGYLDIGLWAREHLPAGTIVGSSQTGALAYFAENLEVINLDGVVNEPCYQSLVEDRNMAYIRREGIRYVLGWQINIEFIKKHSSHWRAGDLKLVEQVEGIRSWGHDWYLYRVQ